MESSNVEWDVCPVTGEKDDKSYEEWRAIYEKEREDRERDYERRRHISFLNKAVLLSWAAFLIPFALLPAGAEDSGSGSCPRPDKVGRGGEAHLGTTGRSGGC